MTDAFAVRGRAGLSISCPKSGSHAGRTGPMEWGDTELGQDWDLNTILIYLVKLTASPATAYFSFPTLNCRPLELSMKSSGGTQ